MNKSLEDIPNINVKKGHGVLEAIVRKAREHGIPFTRRELLTLGSAVCSRLDRDKLKKECLVQPGEISIKPEGIKEKPGKIKELVWDGLHTGLEKHQREDGSFEYRFKGKELKKI